MRIPIPLHRQLALGPQVVVGEHIQISLQRLRGKGLARQVQAQGRYLRCAEVVI